MIKLSISVLVAAAIALGLTTAVVAQSAPAQRATGLLPTPPEELAKVPASETYRAFLPPAVDLSNYFPDVGDQGSLGSCTTWAVGYAARAYYSRMVEGVDTSLAENIPSPAFLYRATRERGDTTCEIGTYFIDVLVLMQRGSASLADYPYDPAATVCPPIPPGELNKYTGFTIDGYERVDTFNLDDVKGKLAEGHPVMISTAVDDDFQGFHGPRGLGAWDVGPLDLQTWKRWHAITLVGYDDALQTFKFINSWSPEWGDDGYARMTYSSFRNRVREGWILKFDEVDQIALLESDYRSDLLGPDPIQQTGPFAGAAIVGEREAVGGTWCGHVETGKDAEGKLIAQGFVDTELALAALSERLGSDVDVSGVEVAAWPLCETRLTLSRALAAADSPSATVATNSDGSWSADIDLPAFGKNVYAVSFGADGYVHRVAVGPDGTADVGADSEVLLVIASEQTFFDGEGPDGIELRPFLTQLREAVVAGGAGLASAAIVSRGS